MCIHAWPPFFMYNQHFRERDIHVARSAEIMERVTGTSSIQLEVPGPQSLCNN